MTAIVTVPKKFSPPYPAVVLLAGSGGHKDTDYLRMSSDMLSTLGYATLSIDAQYHGDRTRPGRTGDIHLINSTTNRDAWVQTVIDLRRAVDYLQSRSDVDGKKIGYLGFSQGRFNDYGAAERITSEGRALLRGMIDWLREHEAKPVEIDTDGIYFVPPDFESISQRDAFRASLQAWLPEGIDVEFDGEFCDKPGLMHFAPGEQRAFRYRIRVD